MSARFAKLCFGSGVVVSMFHSDLPCGGLRIWRQRCMPTTRSCCWNRKVAEKAACSKARSVLPTFFQRGLALTQPHMLAFNPCASQPRRGIFIFDRRLRNQEYQLDPHQTTILPALKLKTKKNDCMLLAILSVKEMCSNSL